MWSQLGNSEKIIELFNNNHQPLDVNIHAKLGFHSWEMLCQGILAAVLVVSWEHSFFKICLSCHGRKAFELLKGKPALAK